MYLVGNFSVTNLKISDKVFTLALCLKLKVLVVGESS